MAEGTHTTIAPHELVLTIPTAGMFYNVTNGYVEGIVRGYRNTLLTGQNYGNLVQCETIDGALPLTPLAPPRTPPSPTH